MSSRIFVKSQVNLSICLSIMTAAAQAAGPKIACPTELDADAVQIVKPPQGWTPFTPTFLPVKVKVVVP